VRRWDRLPAVMERTLLDDLRWAAFVLAGATIGWLILGADDPSVLLGFVIAAVVVIAAFTVIRTVARTTRSRRGR